ncbi:MAG: 4-diphosphocytidyl-2-C-methyl-D-erythritol kinase [Candidatus Dichloromethanomonas elyunquensis]|nr:MAG: 4-diphosphocytidyl-2-C-methyl-D-erythritol kinase [Candidatus Dichloromethanomonas elyunquensis]
MKNLSIEVLAPAKVNLSLAIKDKRADGFHHIETIFQSISLFDRLEVKVIDQGITCKCGRLSGKDNLAYRAAQAFLEMVQKKDLFDQTAGVEIRIEKNIPLQAGLGGGSSDAAAVLKVMNQLFGNPLAAEDLLACAKRCGSDTAFFLRGGTQWGEGTGADLTDLSPTPDLDIVLVKPPGGVSTAAAYRTFDEIGKYASLNRELWVELLKNKDTIKIGQNLINSLEDAAFKLLPEIAFIKKQLLDSGCCGALMSGSGSAVFGILDKREQGEAITDKLVQKGFDTWLVKTIQE